MKVYAYLHIALFAVWIMLIEESPWPTLTLIVSLDAIFLTLGLRVFLFLALATV